MFRDIIPPGTGRGKNDPETGGEEQEKYNPGN